MTTELITPTTWGREEVELLKQTVARGTTDLEFKLFAQVCQKTGLDPFTKQIYAIKRRTRTSGGGWTEVMSIQTGIDGYRVIAERTGEYVGGHEPTYGPPCDCGVEALGVHPAWCVVSVVRVKDGREYLTSERADFDEYVQRDREGKPTGMWAKMPKRMLAKCAEALALRRAFPGRFEGVYTSEEMSQADVETMTPELVRQPSVRVLPVPERQTLKAGETSPDDGPPIDFGQPAANSVPQAVADVFSATPTWKIGDLCPACLAEGLGGTFYMTSRRGPAAGKLICNGTKDGRKLYHVEPTQPVERVGALVGAAPTDEPEVKPDDVPF